MKTDFNSVFVKVVILFLIFKYLHCNVSRGHCRAWML